ncbi:GNAT family N-acetyltransferase [Paenibacillaceae bacterium]|nr:GNAT family N-acetyltransferase [Paenibacillaceae bacterium]
MMVIPMSAGHAQTICQWQYPPPYELFNWPAWDEMLSKQVDFGDVGIRKRQFAAVINGEGELVGYAQFFALLGVIRLGLGLRPDLCSQGRGGDFVRVIVEEARRRAPGDEIDLEVYTWNLRAIHVYQKSGFIITDTYERLTHHGPAEVHCMVWQPQRPS